MMSQEAPSDLLSSDDAICLDTKSPMKSGESNTSVNVHPTRCYASPSPRSLRGQTLGLVCSSQMDFLSTLFISLGTCCTNKIVPSEKKRWMSVKVWQFTLMTLCNNQILTDKYLAWFILRLLTNSIPLDYSELHMFELRTLKHSVLVCVGVCSS